MGWLRQGTGLTQDTVHDFLTRQGVALVTLAVHLSLFWGHQSQPMLVFVIAHALIYPTFMLWWQGSRKNPTLSLSADTALYGIYQGLWGFQPMLLMAYGAGSTLVNLATGGPKFLIRAVFIFATGLFIGAMANGFYLRSHLSQFSTIAVNVGLMGFLGAYGYRVYKINTRLRSTRNRLREQKEELTSINQLALAVNSHLEIDILLEKIMHTIERVYPFEALYIVTFDEYSHATEVAGIFGSSISLDEHASFTSLKFDAKRDKNSLFVRSLVNRKLAYIPEVTPELIQTADDIDRQLYSVKPSKSLIYLPVYVKNRVVAGACFINYENRFYLNQHDIERIQDFLIQVGTAIRNTTLFKDLVQAKEEADIARKKAEVSEETKSRFLANMSHEIRTPLTAVMGYTEALQEDDISEQERTAFLGYILRSGKHLLSMISDILDISKIEAGKIEVEKMAFNYLETLYDLDSYLQVKCKEKHLGYGLNVHLPIPQTITTDPTRLKQILLNLCNNAVKFTENGSISLAIHFVDHRRIEFQVTDTGIGITAEERKKIFSAFDQADSSTTRLFGGTGLGLYISRNLASLLGGKLLVESTKGIGSTFTLQLPVAADGLDCIRSMSEFEQIVESVKSAKHMDGVPRLNGRVLLADDNKDNQNLVTRLVKLTGLEIEVVDNGQLAIEALKEKHYDLVLMDMQMPVMGGKQATEIISRNPNPPPVVAFTANVMKHQIAEYEALNFIEIIEKPIVRQTLFSALEKILKVDSSNLQRSVLVVEDNAVIQMILSRHVSKACPSAKITTTANGAEAINATKEQQFDLIFMDMEMPVMGGLEATKALRAAGAKMPIYMVTGHTDKHSQAQCLAAGATAQINKPIDKQAIAEVITSAFGSKH